MKYIEAEVLTDPDASDGGYALIRFKGVYVIPGPPTFMIEPLDPDIDTSLLVGWPSGPQRARASRVTTDGLEMSIGPEIVDCPALEPGLPVAITVPSASAQAELRWPDLPLSPSGRHLPSVMTIDQHAAVLEAAERAEAAERERALQALAEEIARQAGGDDVGAEGDYPPDVYSTEDPPHQDGARSDVSGAAAAERLSAAVSAAAAVLHLNGTNATRPDGMVRGSDGFGDDRLREGRGGTRDAAAVSGWGEGIDGAVAGTLPGRGGVAQGPRANTGLASLSGRGTLPAAARAGELARVPTRDLASLDRKGGQLTLERHDSQPTFHGSATGYAGSFVLGLLVMVGAIVALLASPLGEPVRAWLVPTTQPRLETVLAPGDRSPAGTAAQDVDLDQALQLADTHLNGADAQDRAEARFWLSKALSSILSDPRATWALTQLGTLQATPEAGVPDFATARALWGMAAARGDPVAHCFLGTLFERGMGTPRDVSMARKHYRAARELGGCPGLEQSLGRIGE